MRKNLVAALTFLTLGGCATAGGYQGRPLGAAYDAMAGLTTVSTPVRLDVDPMITASFSFSGQTQQGPVETATLRFDERNDGWQYLQNHTLMVLVNGTDRMQYEGVHHGDVESGGWVKEQVTVSIPLADLDRMGQARTLAFRIGPKDLNLKAGDIGRIRNLADAMAMRPYTPPAPK